LHVIKSSTPKRKGKIMKKIISLLTVAVFLTFGGLVFSQTQEAKKETKEIKKTVQVHKTVKKAKKSCETCSEKGKCADEKKIEKK
jgi:CHASE3 domain sensor protein